MDSTFPHSKQGVPVRLTPTDLSIGTIAALHCSYWSDKYEAYIRISLRYNKEADSYQIGEVEVCPLEASRTEKSTSWHYKKGDFKKSYVDWRKYPEILDMIPRLRDQKFTSPASFTDDDLAEKINGLFVSQET